MAPIVEKLPIPPVDLGEGPHWDSKTQSLYLVDVKPKLLIKYVPDKKQVTSTKVEFGKDTIHFIIPVERDGKFNNEFAIATGRNVYIVEWDGKNDSKVVCKSTLMELDKDHPANVINDAKVDHKGTLFTGTIGIDPEPSDPSVEFPTVPTGSFYSRHKDGTVTKHDSGITLSNGIAFDTKVNALYHIDSFKNCIRRFDYNPNAVDCLSNKSILFDYKAAGEEGFPDGMTIDTDGNIWVASITGGNVLKINPNTGKVLTRVELPTKIVTSCTFGGKNLDILYVTTGFHSKGEGDGGTYAVTGLGVRGYTNNPLVLE